MACDLRPTRHALGAVPYGSLWRDTVGAEDGRGDRSMGQQALITGIGGKDPDLDQEAFAAPTSVV
ncbi:hypothetical protein ACFRLW_17885, partial [Streptomyces sp. NPDC056728]